MCDQAGFQRQLQKVSSRYPRVCFGAFMRLSCDSPIAAYAFSCSARFQFALHLRCCSAGRPPDLECLAHRRVRRALKWEYKYFPAEKVELVGSAFGRPPPLLVFIIRHSICISVCVCAFTCGPWLKWLENAPLEIAKASTSKEA